MQLPPTPYPLYTLAEKTSNPEQVKLAIDKSVINFFLEAWVALAANDLRATNMLDGITPIGALDRGRQIFALIEQDFLRDYDKKLELDANKKE